MLKAVIFDVDGTLIDSVPQHARAWQDVFQDFGRDIPVEDIRRQIGKAEELQQAGCIAIYRDPTDLLAHYDG